MNPTPTTYLGTGRVPFAVWEAEIAPDRYANSYLKPFFPDLYKITEDQSALSLAHLKRESEFETQRDLLDPEDNNPYNLRPNGSERPAGMTGVKNGYLTFRSPLDSAREWRRRVIDDRSYVRVVYDRKGNKVAEYRYLPTMTLEDYLGTYALVGDAHETTGDANETYTRDVLGMLKRFAEREKAMATATGQKIIAISGGHRNTDRGGTTGERDLMDDYADILRDTFEAAGAKVYVLQEHDNDSNPTDSLNYGLQRVAMIAAELEKKYGFQFDAYVSSHYNGTGNSGGSGFHAIFPDARSGVDTMAGNSRDVAVCKAMAAEVKATDTVGLISWTRTGPGVMSEQETGVGSTWYPSAGAYGRLGEFVGTMGIRAHAVRIIIEAGNIHNPREASYLRDLRWVKNVYAPAIVRGLAKVIGPMGKPATTPPVDPVPTDPNTKSPVFLPEYQAYKDRPVESIPLVISAASPLGGRENFVKTWATVETTGPTKRLQGPDEAGPVVGPDLKLGEEFFVPFVGFHNGRPYTRTFWGTWIYLDQTDLAIRG